MAMYVPEICEWCKEECNGTLHAIVNGESYIVCVTCLNLLANQDYDELNNRIEQAPQICELQKKAKELELNKVRD
jgi:hypothetical protein